MNVIYGQLTYYKKLICTFTISRDQPIMFILLLRYSVVLKYLICYAHYISPYWCKMALNRILQQLQNSFSVKSVNGSSWNSKCLWVGVTDLRSVQLQWSLAIFLSFCWILLDSLFPTQSRRSLWNWGNCSDIHSTSRYLLLSQRV